MKVISCVMNVYELAFTRLDYEYIPKYITLMSIEQMGMGEDVEW